MVPNTLLLPERVVKPRARGLTILIDSGVPIRYFQDVIESNGAYIDLVKFGWGTSLVTDRLAEKVACLQRNNVDYFFVGTLFEKFYHQRKLDDYYDYCKRYGCRYVEISNGTIDLPNSDKARVIADFAEEFTVLSEVGYKDSDRSLMMAPSTWITYIRQDLAA